jgi:DNA-binding MarR family transcriptional regulator
MGASPKFTEAAILDRIRATPGKRYTSQSIARSYGVSQASMTQTLENLCQQGLIRKQMGSGAASWYVPDEAQKQAEAQALAKPWQASFRPLKLDPVLLRRVAESQALREAFPSKFHD